MKKKQIGRRRLDRLGAEAAHLVRLAVVRLDHALAAQQLDPLVVAVDRGARAVDVAHLPVRAAQDDHGRVDLVQLGAQFRVDQRAGDGEDLLRLVVQHVARQVEVVDGHVAQQAAGRLEVGPRRNFRIARGDDHLVQVADLAGLHGRPRGAVAGIEAAVEADLDRHVVVRDGCGAAVDPVDVDVDRLLAKDRLAGPGRGLDQSAWVSVAVAISTASIPPLASRSSIESCGGDVQLRRDGLGRGAVDIEDGAQARLLVARDVAGVHGADPPAAQNR